MIYEASGSREVNSQGAIRSSRFWKALRGHQTIFIVFQVCAFLGQVCVIARGNCARDRGTSPSSFLQHFQASEFSSVPWSILLRCPGSLRNSRGLKSFRQRGNILRSAFCATLRRRGKIRANFQCELVYPRIRSPPSGSRVPNGAGQPPMANTWTIIW